MGEALGVLLVFPSAQLQLGPPAPRVDYLNAPADQPSAPLWSTTRHGSIPGYRGRPGGDNEERYWNPAMPPCVPSDHRPAHLFNSRDAAEAAGMASRVEQFEPRSEKEVYRIPLYL